MSRYFGIECPTPAVTFPGGTILACVDCGEAWSYQNHGGVEHSALWLYAQHWKEQHDDA